MARRGGCASRPALPDPGAVVPVDQTIERRAAVDVMIAGFDGGLFVRLQHLALRQSDGASNAASSIVRKNSNSSAYPSMAQASPRVQVLKGEYPCCVARQRKLPSLRLKTASWLVRPRTSYGAACSPWKRMYWFVYEAMQDRSLEQIGGPVVLVHQLVAELPRDAEDAAGPHRVDEERVGAVEGIDVTEAAVELAESGDGGFAGTPAQRLACTAPLALIARS